MHQTILIADDSSTIREVVRHTLGGQGIEVLVASDGHEALHVLKEQRPRLAIIDVLMPGLTGYEVIEEARRDAALRDVPMLLLTGAFEPFDEGRAAQCGARGSLGKPFDPQRLLEQVESLLRESPSEAPPPPPPPPPEDEPLGALFDEAPELPAAASPPEDEPLGGVELVSETETTAPVPVIDMESPSPTPSPSREMLSPDEAALLESPAVEEDAAQQAATADWERMRVPLPGDADFDLSPEPTPAVAATEAHAADAAPPLDDEIRAEIRERIERLAPEIVREVAWEVVPDLLERLLRESAPNPRYPGDKDS